MIDLNEDFSFDPLTDGGSPLDPEPAGDEAVDAESHAHAALFAHVGVTDLTDWRAVALQLARTHIPGVLNGSETAPPRRKAGRPTTWDALAQAAALSIIEEIKEHSSTRYIKKHLPTDKSACEFFLFDKEASSYRDRCRSYFPTNISAEAMQNAVIKARKSRPPRVIETPDKFQ